MPGSIARTQRKKSGLPGPLLMLDTESLAGMNWWLKTAGLVLLGIRRRSPVILRPQGCPEANELLLKTKDRLEAVAMNLLLRARTGVFEVHEHAVSG